jgi:hypothetical protein
LAALQRASTLSESNPITLTIALGAASAAACTTAQQLLTHSLKLVPGSTHKVVSASEILESIKSFYLKHESMSFTVGIETKLLDLF